MFHFLPPIKFSSMLVDMNACPEDHEITTHVRAIVDNIQTARIASAVVKERADLLRPLIKKRFPDVNDRLAHYRKPWEAMITAMCLARRNYDRIVMDTDSQVLNEVQRAQRTSIQNDRRYYLCLLLSQLYCIDEKGEKTGDLRLYEDGAVITSIAGKVSTFPDPLATPQKTSNVVTPRPTPQAAEEKEEVHALATYEESDDPEVQSHDSAEESDEAAVPVRRSQRIPKRRTDLPVESPVGKRSCSSKKRRLVATTTASRDEEFLSKLSEVTEEYASSCDDSLIARVRKFLSELTGKPCHDEEEEEEDSTFSSDSTSSSDPLAHLPYWNDNKCNHIN
ncbi:hypothetical protein EON65_17365 [archaeon]|nr:MAG: hypothetical protein EON65_17365 [archaeon]